MKCFYHPEVDAVMTCSSCGKELCRDCVVENPDGKTYCKDCIKKGLDGLETVVIICGSVCVSPILALIAWLIWKGNKPEKAKQASYICIGTAILYIVLIILYVR
ncbi:MAG: hypothetical protein CVT88_08110 [Candidatus Altiarchaeales archaeon HGW-Altiarchaeales-1]|nr:MAG: hypothetical protein CVT88_08110 [Candidatus Altiarchaeales archaeon HGW-Altiarchaeales-1]